MGSAPSRARNRRWDCCAYPFPHLSPILRQHRCGDADAVNVNGQVEICRSVDTAMLMVVTPKSELRFISVSFLRKLYGRIAKNRTVIALVGVTQAVSSCRSNACRVAGSARRKRKFQKRRHSRGRHENHGGTKDRASDHLGRT